jgi:rare lipoprotein A
VSKRCRRATIARAALLLACASLLSACSSPRPAKPSASRWARMSAPSPAAAASKAPRAGGGYYLDDGPAADVPANLDAIPNATPQVEPLGKFANRPYNVFGIDYVPQLDLNEAYRQRGIASWYGRKFHGQKTSSGEPYDMFAMTAAHPTLPIPCYVRVSNPRNGRWVIVRVNDRGPFLHQRLIDLSYTAAYKLGYVNDGSAEVEVEKLTPDLIAALRSGDGSEAQVSPVADPIAALAQALPADINPVPISPAAEAALPVVQAPPSPATTTGRGYWLQLGAFGTRINADNLQRRVSLDPAVSGTPLQIIESRGMFRLMSGPFAERAQAQTTAQRLQTLLRHEPLLVQQ